ncbi:MAG: hypothetical protein ACRYF2_04905 [Janthinobacterium lividum]
MRRDTELAVSEIASTMSRQDPAVRITVEGSPMAVQRIADAIETMIPGFMDWHDHALSGSNGGHLVIEGAEAHPPVCKI